MYNLCQQIISILIRILCVSAIIMIDVLGKMYGFYVLYSTFNIRIHKAYQKMYKF